MTQAPTVDELGALGDLEKALEQVEQQARQKAKTAEVGETLAETNFDGMQMRWKKQNTMVRMGETALPERVTVFDRFGMPSEVPTAALRYHLSKTNRQGQRVFFAKPPEGVAERVPLDVTCEVCLKTGARKKFYEEYDFEGHMEVFHPREWRIIQRRQDKEERQATTAKDFAAVLLTMGDKEKAALRALLGTEEKPKREAKKCPECDDYFVSKAHRAHTKGGN